jgi:hypothetical protein
MAPTKQDESQSLVDQTDKVSLGLTSLAVVSLAIVLGVIPAAVVGTIVFLFSVHFPDKLILPKCDFQKILLDDTSPQSSPTLVGAEADNYVRENQKLVPRRCVKYDFF